MAMKRDMAMHKRVHFGIMYGKFAKVNSSFFFHTRTRRHDATGQKRINPEDGFSREPLDSAHARKCCHPWRLRRDDDGSSIK